MMKKESDKTEVFDISEEKDEVMLFDLCDADDDEEGIGNISDGQELKEFCAGAGDLAGGSGENWDTHRDNFKKLKERLLPIFDRSVSALFTDLEMRGLLEETLVVFLTDFGRTPKINNNAGRDHYPAVYSMAFAGGGIRGGQLYGSSDSNGARPLDDPCTPGDFHATALTAMGIDPHKELKDQFDRPFQICNGTALPLF